MHPTAHVSTPKEYCLCPKRTSGALYQRVSISCVRVLIGMEKAQARPKSAIFSKPVLGSIRRFWGLRSLCIILLLWQWTSPSSNCFIKTLIYSWLRGCPRLFMNFFRSNSQYSKAKSNLFRAGS